MLYLLEGRYERRDTHADGKRMWKLLHYAGLKGFGIWSLGLLFRLFEGLVQGRGCTSLRTFWGVRTAWFSFDTEFQHSSSAYS